MAGMMISWMKWLAECFVESRETVCRRQDGLTLEGKHMTVAGVRDTGQRRVVAWQATKQE